MARNEDQVEAAAKEKARLQGNIAALEGTQAEIAAQRKMISQEVMRLTGHLVNTQGVNAGYTQAVRELELETGSLLDQVSTMQARKADLLGRVAAYRAESGKLTK